MASPRREITPPPSASRLAAMTGSPMTPEQVKRMEENRLKAKMKLQQRAQEQQRQHDQENKRRRIAGIDLGESSSRLQEMLQSGSKGPAVESGENLEPTAPQRNEAVLGPRAGGRRGPAAGQVVPESELGPSSAGSLAPLPRDKRLGQYFEYDLSKMLDSKGGFLVDEDENATGTKSERMAKALEKMELQRELTRRKILLAQDPPLSMDPSENPKCEKCGSVEIDHHLEAIFHVLVCGNCKKIFPERYSLLTKTECKEDYLLTDPELKDEEILPHWLKPNPRQSSWNNMMLFLRSQVEDFAFKKWGGEEGLDQEFQRREDEKKVKKGKKFELKLADLRKKTRGDVLQKRQDAQHIHKYGPTMRDAKGQTYQVCDCGLKIEIETF